LNLCTQTHTISSEQINILQKLETLEKEPTNNSLDEPISEYEIISAARKLKNNKSSYSDTGTCWGLEKDDE
jgi:hypothetical protein